MLSGLIGPCETRTLLRGVLEPEQAGLSLSKPGNSCKETHTCAEVVMGNDKFSSQENTAVGKVLTHVSSNSFTV